MRGERFPRRLVAAFTFAVVWFGLCGLAFAQGAVE